MSIGPLYVIVILYYINKFLFENQQDVLKDHNLIQTEVKRSAKEIDRH